MNPIYPDINKPLNSALPRQQLSLKQKLEDRDKFGNSEWMKDCMDAIEAIGRFQLGNNLKLKENYEIIKGRFVLEHYLDSEDFFDMASAISQEFQLPKYLKHYDITTKAVDLLVGEYLNRPDLFRVTASDADSTNERVRVKTELVQQYLQSQIQKEITAKLMAMGLDPNKKDFKNEQEAQQYQQEIQAKYQELTPEAIETYMTYDFRTSAEHWGNAVLSNDKYKFRFREMEKEEFTDMLVADRCFSHFYMTPTGYNVENWNPVNTFWHQSPEVKYVEDGDYVGRTFFMSRAQAIDRYGWRMSVEEQENLYPKWADDTKGKARGYNLDQTVIYPFKGYDSYRTIQQGVQASIGFNPLDRTNIAMNGIIDVSDGTNTNWSFAQGDLVMITEGYWRSQRRVGFLSMIDEETGEPINEIVDETFEPKLFNIVEKKGNYYEYKFNPEPNTITWCWTNQIWQGIKINQANFNIEEANKQRTGIYIDIRPTSFQFKGDYNPFNPKLPVCGGIFDNRNGRSMSLVDKLKPYQIFYNAIWNQMYGILQRNNGKFFLMDVNVLPSLKDWGGEEALERFKAMADATSIGLIDTAAGAMTPNAFAASNGFNVVDLSEHDKIQALMNLAILVEQQGFVQIGITQQRQGQMQASSTATSDQAAISQSFAITETYFENYSNYKTRKLNMHLALAQYVASLGEDGDITLPYITSDLGNAWVKVNKTELLLRDLGVNIENSRESAKQKQMAEQLALNNNTSNIPLSGLIKMIRMTNLTDMEKSLEVYEANFHKQEMEKLKQQQEMQQQALEAEAREKQADRDNAVHIAEIKAKADLQKATLTGIANESSFDPNVDLTDKLIAQRDISLKENQAASQNYLAQQALVQKQLADYQKGKLEKEKLGHDKKLKESEQASKKEIENQKLAQIKEQNKSQEKISDNKHKADMALAKEQLKMKELEKEMKLLDIQNAKTKANLELNSLEKKVKVEENLGKVKIQTIKEIADAKIAEQENLAKVKSKEIVQATGLKMKENVQNHEHKLIENTEKHKEKLKQIKIKPKINKKK